MFNVRWIMLDGGCRYSYVVIIIDNVAKYAVDWHRIKSVGLVVILLMLDFMGGNRIKSMHLSFIDTFICEHKTTSWSYHNVIIIHSVSIHYNNESLKVL
jgi:hypothetical protein